MQLLVWYVMDENEKKNYIYSFWILRVRTVRLSDNNGAQFSPLFSQKGGANSMNNGLTF